MRYRSLGNSGILASVVGFGTWGISGGSVWEKPDDDLSVYAIHKALDEGINLVDTAPFYGFGHGERLVGKALTGRRSQAVVVTKCGLWWDSDKRDFAFDRDGYRVYRALDPATIYQEVDASLIRLNTDYIDLYMTHWPERGEWATPIADTMQALMNLKQQGKIRAIGACNVTLSQIRQYEAAGRLDAVQNHFSLVDQSLADEALRAYLQAENIALLSWRPLQQGLLTGRKSTDESIADYRSNAFWFQPENRQKIEAFLDELQPFCDRYGCDTAQLVCAWTLAQPGVSHLLLGMKNTWQVESAQTMGDLVIGQQELSAINAMVKRFMRETDER